jgi:hypothetical protein
VPETANERANRLLRIGMDVACRLYEEPADAVATHLAHLDWREMRDLVMVMGGCIDVDKPVSQVVRWTDLHELPRNTGRYDLMPCGTYAAYRRHVRRGEPVDLLCEAGYLRHLAGRRDGRALEAAA